MVSKKNAENSVYTYRERVENKAVLNKERTSLSIMKRRSFYIGTIMKSKDLEHLTKRGFLKESETEADRERK